MPRINALSTTDYLRLSRSGPFCILSVVTLLAVHEAGLLWIGSGQRNAAGFWLGEVLDSLLPMGRVLFHLTLLVLFLLSAVRYARQGASFLLIFAVFLLESAVWAAVLAPAVLFLRSPFLALPGGEALLLDIGAGVYEEIVFRLLLLGGVLRLARLDPWTVYPVDGASRPRARHHLGLALLAVGFSALCFAAYHHVGPGGQEFTWGLFLFRTLAGFLLSLIYLVRGLGVAVYAHAIYDILVHFL